MLKQVKASFVFLFYMVLYDTHCNLLVFLATILQRLKNSFAKFDDIIKEQGEIKYNALKKINEAKEYKVQVFSDDESLIRLNDEIAELKAEIERQVKAAKEQAKEQAGLK